MGMGMGMGATGIPPGFAGEELDGAEGAVRTRYGYEGP